MELATYTVLVWTWTLIQGLKVSHRFGGSAPKDCNCRMQMLAVESIRDASATLLQDFKIISGFDKAK